MSAAPIYTALEIVRQAMAVALPTAHWQRNDSANPVRPYLIYDSQDGGGFQWRHIGALAWRGLIVIRAIGDYQDQADQALAPTFAAMETITTAEPGYSLRAIYDRRISLAPSNSTRYALAQWEVFIERT